MQKLVWINSKGTEINLTSGDYGITEWEGFSACDVEVQTQNVPFQDGSVFLDALLNNKLSLVGGTMTGSLIFDNSTASQKNEPGIK